RTAHELSAAELQRLDMGYKISTGLIVDPIRASHFHTVHLLLALRAGEPARVARALCGEMIYQASLGHGDRRTEHLVAAARQLAEKTRDPHVLALVLGGSGLAAYLQGRWRSARDGAERALKLFREKCTGVPWEVMQCEIFMLRCLYFLGEIKEITRRLPRALQEARSLGNLYGASQVPAGEMVIHSLARDDVEGARAEAAEAFANWSQEGTHLIDHLEMLGRAHIDLYAGQAQAALHYVHERWDDLHRAMFMRV